MCQFIDFISFTNHIPSFSYSKTKQGEGDTSQKEYETNRRLMLRNKQLGRSQRNIIGTPPPCKGRKHENVQTEKYLEEVKFVFFLCFLYNSRPTFLSYLIVRLNWTPVVKPIYSFNVLQHRNMSLEKQASMSVLKSWMGNCSILTSKCNRFWKR